MRISIRLTAIVALNGFVICLALILGWVAQDVAGRLVEERYVKEMVASASGFLKSRSYPRSDAMMGHLRELFNAEWAVRAAPSGSVVASSLAGQAAEQLREQIGRLGHSGTVHLDGQPYRVDSADVDVTGTDTRAEARGRLYMLVPDAQFQQARRRARERVARVIWPAAAVATVLAVLLSFSITHPIRRLADQMDRLSDADVPAPTPPDRAVRRSPKEVARLANSFYRLMARLGEARRQMVLSEQLAALGKISLSVAHELRNPLSGIRMNVRVLKDRETLRGDAGLEAILREIDRMGLYLDELMSLSPGADPADRQMSLSTTQLSGLADSVLMVLAGRLRHAKIEVETDFPPDEPTVVVDASQMRQAMMNLLVNAMEATPAGGTVSVAIRRSGSSLRLCVADTGQGVQADGRDIFAAFTTGKPNGVGLGLYITRQIITRHGGRIGYENRDGGATFWFELPVESARAEDAQSSVRGRGGVQR